MSKLTIVRQSLETNPEVVMVHIGGTTDLPDRNGFCLPSLACHHVYYWVAPKNGLYTADELQTFMMGLVPGLIPTKKDDFRYDKNSDLEFGKLYFDEKVGEERIITKRTITLTDEELLSADVTDKELIKEHMRETFGFVDGKRTIDADVTKEYMRRILVSPFPNEAFARDVLNEKLGLLCRYCVKPSDLRRYQPNLVQRVLGRK